MASDETSPAQPSPWYASGLRFACTRCGSCCTGAPGMVRATDEEVRAMAAHLELDEGTFRDRYADRLGSGGVALRERSDHACVFWRDGAGCVVYPARPRQCRTWPFWRANVATARHWERAGQACPGIGDGPLHDAAAIRTTSRTDGTSGVVPDLDAES